MQEENLRLASHHLPTMTLNITRLLVVATTDSDNLRPAIFKVTVISKNLTEYVENISVNSLLLLAHLLAISENWMNADTPLNINNFQMDQLPCEHHVKLSVMSHVGEI